MSGLFDNDEAYIQAEVKKKRKLVRNRSGRFCSEDEKRIERIEHENEVLRHRSRYYYANWMAVGDRAVRLDRENHELRKELKECKKLLKEHEKRTKRKVGKARL